ncbi:hypothetical protein OK016_03380 [Vibrio chagasii]|nr:hypothetical protein [Vibrio chagasii]
MIFERDDDMLVYDRYVKARNKLSFFSRFKILEELPNQYMLIISNSPVKENEVAERNGTTANCRLL